MKIKFSEDNLPEPREVFRFFGEISRIPRPSYKEKAISDYLVRFAEDRNLFVCQDDLYNVIMIKEATPGYEAEPPIILQGHMDMVCEKAPGCEKDMDREGLDLYLEDDLLRAEGTTLGGDDGIAVAYALALLDDDALQHPRLEFVCTVSEEVGMEGAAGIDLSILKGRRLLNLDSEEEGHFLAGCAGGGTVRLTGRFKEQTPSAEDEFHDAALWRLRVAGLTGGHSGTEIHRGRASAHQLLAQALLMVSEESGCRIAGIRGGTKDNAIPREAEAVIAVPKEKIKPLPEKFLQLEAEWKDIYKETDPALSVIWEPLREGPEKVLSQEDTRKVIALLLALPDGVQRMSQSVPGMTETSLNLGVLRLEEGELYMETLLRSQVNSACRQLKKRVFCIAEGFGIEPSLRSEYPAWEYVKESPFRERLCRVYREMTGKEPLTEVIHAGVECGLLAEKLPGLDAVSMGPDIFDIHTPEERLSVSSAARVYDFIKKMIEAKNM